MKRKKTKLLVSVLAVMLCMAAFSVTAFASGDDWCEYGDYGTPDAAETTVTETPTPTPTPAPSATPTPTPTASADATPAPSETPDTAESADPSGDGEIGHSNTLTPTGNLTLVDDVRQVSGNTAENEDGDAETSGKDDELEEKQFITVQSKNGNYFYLIIDRSGDTENVHFLNQVDEADLMALMEDDSAEETAPVCICTDKCVVGNINTACPVCQTTMSECTGKEPEPEPTEEPDTEPEEPETKSDGGGLLLIVLVLALAGGGAVYYFKFRKPKTDTKGPVDLDDYDFGDDDEDDEDYEYEPDDDEPEERNEGD